MGAGLLREALGLVSSETFGARLAA
jgi:hypothetical protein